MSSYELLGRPNKILVGYPVVYYHPTQDRVALSVAPCFMFVGVVGGTPSTVRQVLSTASRSYHCFKNHEVWSSWEFKTHDLFLLLPNAPPTD